MSLAPIWIRRGEWPAVIWPNDESARLLSTPPEEEALPPPEPKLSWFQALKNSPRSWKRTRSPMLVFLMAGFNILKITSVSDSISQVVAYIPNVLVATVMVVVGLLVAGFLRGVIATSADRVGVSYAEQLASGCYYIMALMVFSWPETRVAVMESSAWVMMETLKLKYCPGWDM